MYDYLIVGAGIFGAICARELTDAGKRCVVIDRRPHIAGNIYSETVEGIEVHKYGAHIFHANNKQVWEYLNRFAEFNNYINCPIANYHGKLYNLPFNMNTFYQLWGVTTPEEAQAKIESQRVQCETPENLEEQALSLAGRDIYETLVKEYTEKQWGCNCSELPPEIIKRLPFRFTFDNNYFNARYQGIPIGGYAAMIDKILDGVEVRLNTIFVKSEIPAKKVIYTGPIDEYFDYQLGALEYRSLRFENEVLDCENYQGNAVVNYTSHDVSYTRIVEHKHFEFGTQDKTVITREYSARWNKGDEPYYPVNDERNNSLYAEYARLAEGEQNVIFGGRLGEYKYYDMDKVAELALEFTKNERLQK
jgi:UDP-galactopyranose mutase